MNEKEMKQALDKLNPQESMRLLQTLGTEIRAVHDNQAQIIPALVTVYQALEVVAAKLDVDLPEPLIDMNVET